MKNYALVENNKVINVSVANNDWDSTGWIECGEVGIGWNYDGAKFYPDQPYSSWTLDSNGVWQPPIPYPADVMRAEWDESQGAWIAQP